MEQVLNYGSYSGFKQTVSDITDSLTQIKEYCEYIGLEHTAKSIGETIEKTVTFQNVAKIKVIKFDIYVDAAGNFLQTTAKVQGFFILGVTLAIMAFLMFASIVLKFSPIFYIMIVFFAIGPVILSLVGSTVSFAELLYFDLTTFIMVFSSVGVYFMLAQFFGRFLLVGHATISEPEKKEKRRNKNAQQELYNLMSTDDRNDTDVHPEDNY